MTSRIHPSLRTLAVSIALLTPDPRNARRHPPKSIEALRNSLERFGQRRPIVVQRQGMIVRAGNGALEAARSLGWKDIAAVIVDEADADATAYALADNRTGDLSEWNDDVLADLLKGLDQEQLVACSFPADLATVIAPAVDVEAEWKGMPEFAQEDLSPLQTIHVHFARPEDREAFAKLIGQPITDKTRALWFPAAEIGRTADRRYKAAGA